MSETKKAPSAREIDSLLAKYDLADRKLDRAKLLVKLRAERTDKLKGEIVQMVADFGAPHAKKSRRLAGAHNTATTTIGTTTSVDDAAVTELKAYLDKSKIPDITKRFFTEHVSYQMVTSPIEVLKTLTLTKKIREKLLGLIALCSKSEPKAASLKVEVVAHQAVAA